MRASDLQSTFPIVGRDTSVLEAARMIAADDLAGLVIADAAGVPSAVIAAVDVLALMVPSYVIDDLALAGVLDEKAAEEVWGNAGQHTIGILLDDDGVRKHELLKIDADDSILEIAARMADMHAQIALIKGERGSEPQFVTLPAVMDAILTFCAPAAVEPTDA